MVIDAHVHISIYQGSATTLTDAFQKLLLDMEQNGVSYAIIIPDNIENDPTIAGLNQAREFTKKRTNLFLLGSPQITQKGEEQVSKYEKLLEKGKIKGIKFFPGHDPIFPTDKRCSPYYQISQKLNTPVIFHTGINPDNPEVAKYNDPKYIVEVAQKYPKLKVIITHYFWPRMQYCYELTKNVPNIFFETAGMADPEVIKATGGGEKVKRILGKTIKDRPRQVIFGTDYPMCRIKDHINLIKELHLSSKEEKNVFFNNAVKIYNLNLLCL